MKEYVIEKTVGAPDWTKVSELQVDNVCWLPDAGVRMEQQICHDDEKNSTCTKWRTKRTSARS